MSFINTPTRTALQIDFADPGGVGNVVVGSDNRTAISQFNFLRANIILDGTTTTTPAAAGDGLTSIRRLSGLTTSLATLITMVATNTTPNKGVFPKGINAGQFQFILEETVAMAAAINVIYTLAGPPI